MKRQIIRKPVKAETEAEMTKKHMVQEKILLDIESLSEASYEEMELPILYQGILDTLQDWPANLHRLKIRGLKEAYHE